MSKTISSLLKNNQHLTLVGQLLSVLVAIYVLVRRYRQQNDQWSSTSDVVDRAFH